MIVRTPDAALHVDIVGDGEPVLLIHGYPLSAALWAPVVSRLAPRWRFITPDLRGFGRNAATAPTATIAQYADDLAALLDELGRHGPVVVGGLSMGGIVALEFYRRYAARVRALVLANTRSNAESPEGRERRRAVAAAALRDGADAIADDMAARLFSPAADAALRRAWRDAMAATSPAAVAAGSLALAERADSGPTLPTIRVPTLVVAGDDDEITPPAGLLAMHEAIAGSRFVSIPAAGHLTPVEQPDAFADALGRFLSDLQS